MKQAISEYQKLFPETVVTEALKAQKQVFINCQSMQVHWEYTSEEDVKVAFARYFGLLKINDDLIRGKAIIRYNTNRQAPSISI